MKNIIESESNEIAKMRMYLEYILNCTLEYYTATLEPTLTMSCFLCITSLYLVPMVLNNFTLSFKKKNKGFCGRQCRQRVVEV